MDKPEVTEQVAIAIFHAEYSSSPTQLWWNQQIDVIHAKYRNMATAAIEEYKRIQSNDDANWYVSGVHVNGRIMEENRLTRELRYKDES